MNKAQLQASLAFNGETLAEAEYTLRHPGGGGNPSGLAMTCETCKHLREVKDLRDRDGYPLTLHYCHAISSFPYRSPDYPACKKWSANPDKI